MSGTAANAQSAEPPVLRRPASRLARMTVAAAAAAIALWWIRAPGRLEQVPDVSAFQDLAIRGDTVYVAAQVGGFLEIRARPAEAQGGGRVLVREALAGHPRFVAVTASGVYYGVTRTIGAGPSAPPAYALRRIPLAGGLATDVGPRNRPDAVVANGLICWTEPVAKPSAATGNRQAGGGPHRLMAAPEAGGRARCLATLEGAAALQAGPGYVRSAQMMGRSPGPILIVTRVPIAQPNARPVVARIRLSPRDPFDAVECAGRYWRLRELDDPTRPAPTARRPIKPQAPPTSRQELISCALDGADERVVIRAGDPRRFSRLIEHGGRLYAILRSTTPGRRDRLCLVRPGRADPVEPVCDLPPGGGNVLFDGRYAYMPAEQDRDTRPGLLDPPERVHALYRVRLPE